MKPIIQEISRVFYILEKLDFRNYLLVNRFSNGFHWKLIEFVLEFDIGDFLSFNYTYSYIETPPEVYRKSNISLTIYKTFRTC